MLEEVGGVEEGKGNSTSNISSCYYYLNFVIPVINHVDIIEGDASCIPEGGRVFRSRARSSLVSRSTSIEEEDPDAADITGTVLLLANAKPGVQQ